MIGTPTLTISTTPKTIQPSQAPTQEMDQTMEQKKASKPYRRYQLRNQSMSMVCFVDENSFERHVVLVDNNRQNYTPRKVLFSLGYMHLRKYDGLRPMLIATDDLNIKSLIIIDIARQDEEGFPIPHFHPARLPKILPAANALVDDNPEIDFLRIDYVVFPQDIENKPLLRVTMKRGVGWAFGSKRNKKVRRRRRRRRLFLGSLSTVNTHPRRPAAQA